MVVVVVVVVVVVAAAGCYCYIITTRISTLASTNIKVSNGHESKSRPKRCDFSSNLPLSTAPPSHIHPGNASTGSSALGHLLLMIEILHDLVYHNSRIDGILYVCVFMR